MTRPMTLLEMAGAAPQPAALSEAAVVVIDAQKEYETGGLALPNLDPKLDQIAALLKRARAASAPIFHIRHLGRPGGLFDPEGDGSQFVAAAAPQGGETIVEKNLPNAFTGTDLEERIGRFGRDKLIVAGFMTHMCVSSTVRAAFDLGYACTVVAGATGTRPLPTTDGLNTLTAEAIHEAALAGLADRFATIAEDVTAIPD